MSATSSTPPLSPLAGATVHPDSNPASTPASPTTTNVHHAAMGNLSPRAAHSASAPTSPRRFQPTPPNNSTANNAAAAASAVLSPRPHASTGSISNTHLLTQPAASPNSYIYTDPATGDKYRVRFIQETIHANGTSTFVQLSNKANNGAQFNALLSKLNLPKNSGINHYVFDQRTKTIQSETPSGTYEPINNKEAYEAYESEFLPELENLDKTPITQEQAMHGFRARRAPPQANSTARRTKPPLIPAQKSPKRYDLSLPTEDQLADGANEWDQVGQNMSSSSLLMGLGVVKQKLTNDPKDRATAPFDLYSHEQGGAFFFGESAARADEAGTGRHLYDIKLPPVVRPVVIPLHPEGHFTGIIIEPPSINNQKGKIIYYDSLGTPLSDDRKDELSIFLQANLDLNNYEDLEIRSSIDHGVIDQVNERPLINCGAFLTRFVEQYFIQKIPGDHVMPDRDISKYRQDIDVELRSLLPGLP